MAKIIFEKIIKSEPTKVFNILSQFENFERLLPAYYPSIVIKSIRDESSLVAEHLKLHNKEFIIMAKHFNEYPHRHEMRVVGGDIKGSYIIEKIIPMELKTKRFPIRDFLQKCTGYGPFQAPFSRFGPHAWRLSFYIFF